MWPDDKKKLYPKQESIPPVLFCLELASWKHAYGVNLLARFEAGKRGKYVALIITLHNCVFPFRSWYVSGILEQVIFSSRIYHGKY